MTDRAKDRLPMRPPVSVEIITKATEELIGNLNKRLGQHGRDGYSGKAEGLGVITEEFWELVEAVRSNDYDAIKEEASDVAVGCLWLMATILAKKEQDRQRKEDATLNFGAKS